MSDEKPNQMDELVLAALRDMTARLDGLSGAMDHRFRGVEAMLADLSDRKPYTPPVLTRVDASDPRAQALAADVAAAEARKATCRNCGKPANTHIEHTVNGSRVGVPGTPAPGCIGGFQPLL